jgi:hypothetical protein
VLALLTLLRRRVSLSAPALRLAATHAIGALAACWTIERIAQFST